MKSDKKRSIQTGVLVNKEELEYVRNMLEVMKERNGLRTKPRQNKTINKINRFYF